MKTYNEFLNESEKITKSKIETTFNGLLSAFDADALKDERKKDIAKAFVSLHSFMTTMTTNKAFPTKLMEDLYNKLFSLYKENGSIVKPEKSYSEWSSYVKKWIVKESENFFEFEEGTLNEYDDLSFDVNYFIKEVVRDLIAGGATLTAMAGAPGIAAAAIAVPAVIHGVVKELDKRDMFIDRGKWSKFLDMFRTTLEDIVDELSEIVQTNNYNDEQCDAIEQVSGKIQAWFHSKTTGNIDMNWKREDKEVNTFMNSYLDVITDFSFEKVKDESGNVDINEVIKLVQDAKNTFDEYTDKYKNINSDDDAKEKCISALSTIVMLATTLNDGSDEFKEMDSYAEKLYNLIFNEYTDRGKASPSAAATLSYGELKTFFKKNYELVNKCVATEEVKNESVMNEKFSIKNLFKKVGKGISYVGNSGVVKTAGEVTNTSFQGLLFEIALYMKMFLVTGMSFAAAKEILVTRFTYYVAENSAEKLFEKLFRNIKNTTVGEKVSELMSEIITYLESKKDSLEQLASELKSSVEEFSVAMNMKPAYESKRYVMSREEFLCESEELNEGLGHKILTGVALIASLLGGPKISRAGNFREGLKDAQTSWVFSVKTNYGVRCSLTLDKNVKSKSIGKLVVSAADVAVDYGYWYAMFKPNAIGQLKTIDMKQGLECPEIMNREVSRDNGVVLVPSNTIKDSEFKFEDASKMLAKIQLGNPQVIDQDLIAFDIIGD